MVFWVHKKKIEILITIIYDSAILYLYNNQEIVKHDVPVSYMTTASHIFITHVIYIVMRLKHLNLLSKYVLITIISKTRVV